MSNDKEEKKNSNNRLEVQAYEYPFDLIDLGFMLLAPSHPLLLIACIVQYILRRVVTKDLHRYLTTKKVSKTTLEPLVKASSTAMTTPATGSVVDQHLDVLKFLSSQLHLLIIGHTRGGKTTLIHELAVQWSKQGFTVLVCDPDAAPGLWFGCKVIGAGDDFDEIKSGLKRIKTLIGKRRSMRAEGVRRFDPVYIIIDEVQDVIREVDITRNLIEDIARRGGKLNIHIILGVQDKLVKTLQLEGQSALRKNFTVVEVRYEDKQRVATITEHDDGYTRRLPVPKLPDLDKLIEANGKLLEGYSDLHLLDDDNKDQLLLSVNTSKEAIERFIGCCVEEEQGSMIQADDLYKAYSDWAYDDNVFVENRTSFGTILKELGYEKIKNQGRVYYKNMSLSEELYGRSDGN